MPFKQLTRSVYLWTDTCNVYVVKDGSQALLIDLGDGSVLDHLAEIGVEAVEWVLFTHHHREQCQGAHRLVGSGIKVAVPEAEKPLFENPLAYRKLQVSLGDSFTVHGASYVRPSRAAIPVDHAFKKMDTFTWRGREFWCTDTRGNSPGGMSYLVQDDGQWIGFTGDVMLSNARLHTWYDTEWDYGFAAGIYALHASVALLEGFEFAWLFPSHGPAIRQPRGQLREYLDKLGQLAKLLLRGYPVMTLAAGDQDRVSRPTAVPYFWQITPHLYKFRGPNFWPNFTMLLADNGHALIVDCGLFEREFLDRTLKLATERLGLKKIDALIITHMHGDHMLDALYLKDEWGAAVWTMDRVADLCVHPERYDYAAPVQSYNKTLDSVGIDRVLKDGETVHWENYSLTVDWMPGQTEFACCIHGKIDHRVVAFTGDNIFGSATDPQQTGHEALVARNSGILEDGYLYAAQYLHGLQPDLLIGGHCWVIDRPKDLIQRYLDWALAMRDCLRSFSTEPDYRYMFDPYWVRAAPYRLSVKPGGKGQFELLVRNFTQQPEDHAIELHAPPGVTLEPPRVAGSTPAESTVRYPIQIEVAADAPTGIQLIAFDITRAGTRHGELFDMLLNIGDPPPRVSPTTQKQDAKPGY